MADLQSMSLVLADWLGNGFTRASAWQVLIYTLVVTHITIAAVTIFLHRCQAHRSLELGPIPSHFFRFWLWMTTGMVTKQWVAIHRKHHAKCETVDDPHSPVTRGIKKVLLEGSELYRAEAKVKDTLDRYGHNTPDDWLERKFYTGRSALGVFLMLYINVALFGVIGMSVWAVQMIWIPITAAGIINGIGHYWGYRNFEAVDASRNVFPWGLIIGGEELHNNHHTYPTSAKLSVKPFEFDISWGYIRAMEMIGWAKVRKVAPKLTLGPVRADADSHTLEAIIANRYEVMASYARTLKAAVRQEIAEHGQGRMDDLKVALRWLHRDSSKVPQAVAPRLSRVVDDSPRLAKLVAMREELTAIWTRTASSRDQLVLDLQAWCKKAEASGIQALHDFAKLLKAAQPTAAVA